MQLDIDFNQTKFNGSDYNPSDDKERLVRQIDRIFNLMKDEKYRTLSEIENITGDPQASISAQLRRLKHPTAGGHVINKRARGDRKNGLFEYQVVVNKSL